MKIFASLSTLGIVQCEDNQVKLAASVERSRFMLQIRNMLSQIQTKSQAIEERMLTRSSTTEYMSYLLSTLQTLSSYPLTQPTTTNSTAGIQLFDDALQGLLGLLSGLPLSCVGSWLKLLEVFSSVV